MESEIELYIKLNEMKEQLVKQIADLDAALVLAAPKDIYLLDNTANEIIIGKYDFPFKQSLANQILYAIRKLGRATVSDIQRYFQMLNSVVETKLIEAAAKQLAREGVLKKRNIVIDELIIVEYTIEN